MGAGRSSQSPKDEPLLSPLGATWVFGWSRAMEVKNRLELEC